LVLGADVVVKQESEEVLDRAGHEFDFVLVVGAEVVDVVATAVTKLVIDRLVSFGLTYR
jgi:hypothetical protein